MLSCRELFLCSFISSIVYPFLLEVFGLLGGWPPLCPREGGGAGRGRPRAAAKFQRSGRAVR